MITGYNTDVKHEERVFHVQTEDKGLANPIIESLIYSGGKIIASFQRSYAALLRKGYSEKAVQELLDSQHRKMLRDIKGGKFDPGGPPQFGAGIITDRSFDELVLEFVRSQAGREGIELLVKDGELPRAGQRLRLDLAVRGQVRNAPVAGARIKVRIEADGGSPLSLFEGTSNAEGRLDTTVEIPGKYAGGRIVVDAVSPAGADQVVLEVPAA